MYLWYATRSQTIICFLMIIVLLRVEEIKSGLMEGRNEGQECSQRLVSCFRQLCGLKEEVAKVNPWIIGAQLFLLIAYLSDNGYSLFAFLSLICDIYVLFLWAIDSRKARSERIGNNNNNNENRRRGQRNDVFAVETG